MITKEIQCFYPNKAVIFVNAADVEGGAPPFFCV